MNALLSKDTISFSFERRLFKGVVSLIQSSAETLFRVKYKCPATGEKHDAALFLHCCPSSGQHIWESRDELPDEMIRKLSRRIELNPTLMSACRTADYRETNRQFSRQEENSEEWTR